MGSIVNLSHSFILRNSTIEYFLELPIHNKEEITKLSWGILHKVLPKEVRNEGIVKNLKGMSSNNMLRGDLPHLEQEGKNPIFCAIGEFIQETEDGEEKEESSYCVDSDFHSFPSKNDIEYKSNKTMHGKLGDFFTSLVLNIEDGLQVNELFCGIELFKPHAFSMVGFSPVIQSSLLIQTKGDNLYFRLKSELKKNDTYHFFESFGDIFKKFEDLIKAQFDFDITADYSKQLESKTHK